MTMSLVGLQDCCLAIHSFLFVLRSGVFTGSGRFTGPFVIFIYATHHNHLGLSVVHFVLRQKSRPSRRGGVLVGPVHHSCAVHTKHQQ